MSEWISIKDDLPPLEVDVLGIGVSGEMQVCRLEAPWPDEPPGWFLRNCYNFYPTHWMPLPNPPTPWRSVIRE